MSSTSSQYASPNAIPPRTSSTGGMSPTPAKSVLQPLAESSWLSAKQTNASTNTVTPTPFNNPLNPHLHTQAISQPALAADGSEDPNHFSHEKYEKHSLEVPPWTDQKESILLSPYTYLFSHPGKDIRAQLIAAFNQWLNVPAPALAIITKVIGMLHTASLLVDDVEDSSLLRRGLPVAHSIFGTAQTINSANYAYFVALQELLKLDQLDDSRANSPDVELVGEGQRKGRKRGEAVRIYTEELVNLHRGQGMDLFWRDTLTVPTEEEYLEMVGNKTGGLFRLAIRLMQAESASDRYAQPTSTAAGIDTNENRNCIPLISLLGTLFQIRDDYLNLLSTTYSTNKGLCEDLTEGKFSFPIIHAIRSDPGNLVLLNIIKQKTNDEEVKRYAVKYMEGMGSFEYCREVVKVLVERTKEEIQKVDGGEGKSKGVSAILEGLAFD